MNDCLVHHHSIYSSKVCEDAHWHGVQPVGQLGGQQGQPPLAAQVDLGLRPHQGGDHEGAGQVLE